MRLPSRERLVLTAVVFALAAVLLALALLQYRWSREVSAAASARMQANLQLSMVAFRQDLYRELAAVCGVFQTTSEMSSVRSAERFEEWSRTATHPQLVSNVFIWEGAGSRRAQLLHLDPARHRLEASSWPDRFLPLRDRLQAISSDLALTSTEARDGRRLFGPGPADLFPLGRPPIFAWSVDQTIPALFHPVFHHSGENGAGESNPAVDWVVIELSRNVLRRTVFPELTQRHFGTGQNPTYEVAVIGGAGDVLYSSSSAFGHDDTVDAALNIFGPPIGHIPEMLPRKSGRRPGPEQRWGFLEPAGFSGPLRFEAIHYSSEDPDWQLIVRHPKGSLEAAVAALDRRNLLISFGVLLVLAATMAMIIVVSQRAHRLARLQMDFVATVSHELRTPLAVISSAADNIADGVVDNKQQVVRYGGVIRHQARQLIQLVEQILLFAAARENRQQFSARLLHVPELLDAALGNTAGLIQAAGFTVEKHIEDNLPPVTGDPSALSQCLQNLITNAIKYGGEERWMGVRAERADGPRGPEVQISVDDRGFGIERAELGHIFEPFYRSPSAATAQIHGTGLGLALAKSIAEAMGGHLTAESEPGRGSSFTLHLPCAEQPLIPTEEPVGSQVGGRSGPA
jgi:two-component system, OmpR family, sensor histidine kinase SenX3